jgi:CubicO group peptidase (beta-lactamase class C family)
MKPVVCLLLVAVLALTVIPQSSLAQDAKRKSTIQPLANSDAPRIARLEAQLESLRQQLKIPAMSAAIVKDQKVVWAKGFGYADVENKIAATEHTSYHLASLTKTFASTIVMQLVQEGKIKLDDPVSKYGITLPSEGVIRVKHLLSHTSEGNPGQQYQYNGNRFAELDKVIQKATGKSFGELLVANILDPLQMNETTVNAPPVIKLKSPDGADQRSADEVKAAVTSLMDGYSSSNADQIERLIAPQQSSFDIEGEALSTFVDGPKIRREFKSGVKVNLSAHNLDVAVYGDTALATCITTSVITVPGEGVRNNLPWRTSFVWNKQGGAWKLIHVHFSPLTGAMITEKQQQKFDVVSKNLAQPYALDKSFNPVKSSYPKHFSASAGLISSVLDMAKYDIAIDQNRFLTKETQQLAFTPMVSTKGESLPYGLGWFTQNYKGAKLIWHYGYWTCNSSLIIKVPERNITFIVMANTDNLSRPTDLGAGDVTSSAVGAAFLKTLILPELLGEALPEVDWNRSAEELETQLKLAANKPYGDLYKKELLTQARIYNSVGKASEATRLIKVYVAMYTKPLPDDLSKKTAVAEITRARDNEDKTVEFSLPQNQSIRIFAIGEGQGGQMFDYGWIESAETGKRVWEMKEPETAHAGGAGKNRKTDTVVMLPQGKYRLRYKSDDSHSFDNWNSVPPDINFWGIALFAKD